MNKEKQELLDKCIKLNGYTEEPPLKREKGMMTYK